MTSGTDKVRQAEGHRHGQRQRTRAQAPPLCSLCHVVLSRVRPLSFPLCCCSVCSRRDKQPKKTSHNAAKERGIGTQRKRIKRHESILHTGAIFSVFPSLVAAPKSRKTAGAGLLVPFSCSPCPEPPPATPHPPATADANGHHTGRERTFVDKLRARISCASLTGFLPCVVRIRRLPVLSASRFLRSREQSASVPRRPVLVVAPSTFPFCPSSRCR